MSAKVGERCGAFQSLHNGVVRLFGYGVRIADEPPKGVKGAEIYVEAGFTNPCLLLDSGEKVYGLESWWGAEDEMKEKFAGLTIIQLEKVDGEWVEAK